MDTTLLEMAHVMSKRSTCDRSSVGVVVALDGRVLSTGFNGAPAGLPHCEHPCVCSEILTVGQHSSECPRAAPCERSVHAEANAVAFAAKYGVALMGSTLYTTLSPCLKCAQLIINVGVVQVIIGKLYRERTGLRLLDDSGIPVTTASGAPWQRLVGV